MKVAAVFIALLSLVAIGSADFQDVVARVVELRVDHFNPLDRRTFDARYFVNSQHWLAGGPLFIYIGDGNDMYDTFLIGGMMFELAEELNGNIFKLEHRYFGESRPTEDTSVENLRFLTVHQVLADIAQFITFVKANYYGARNSRVILWGRNMGGTYAVWARQKYPNLVDGVWASSAPINAVLQNPSFMTNTFGTILQIGGPECGDIINGAFRFIEDAIRARNTTYVEQRMRLCTPIDIDLEEDIARLYYGIAADIGQRFVANARYPDIDDKCIIMRSLNTPNDMPENDLDAFSRWFVDDFNQFSECLNYNNDEYIRWTYSTIEWDTVATITGRRQNLWLECTALGMFPIANEGNGHPFGWRFDIQFFRQWCAQAFGADLFTGNFLQESIEETNALFGGLHPAVYRVFFTHGEMDPRRSLGPNDDLNDNSPVVVMSLQSAGRDFGSPSTADYAVLVQTKERARELIMQWIFDSIDENTTPGPTTSTTGEPIPAQ